jgi:hypothetical protein
MICLYRRGYSGPSNNFYEVSITFRGLSFKTVMQILCICVLILVIRHVGSVL